ncbi:hypothetical protein [Marinobacter sp. BGYM27]|uniref:hypothetical protein n=1 Tax=Marinobacter sp. BGYM27 TaxID=2975597 RepID=UPI0021A7E223|nr:hypothetical protein [Marinobacter sp. BGYM27]MDG5498085.1 hypothetical protein [Marinobacter sp. BGYM27]
MNVIASEAQRQFYLSSMGVTLWYARDLLPGAAPSPAMDFSEPESVALNVNSSPEAARPAGAGDSGQQVSVKELIKSVGGKGLDDKKPPLDQKSVDAELPETRPESPAQDVSPAKPVPEVAVLGTGQQVFAEALSNTTFQLGVWCSPSYCLLSPYSSEVSDELQNRLAANILLALESASIENYRLAWPVFNNIQVFSNPASDLGCLLQNLRKDKIQERRILMLGALVDNEGGVAEMKSILGQAVVESPFSVAGLAADPRNKRELWLQLKERVLGIQ